MPDGGVSSARSIAGIEGGEDDDLAAGAGDRDVEPPLAAAAVQRAEVERQDALVVRREAGGEQDDVTLVALDVLEVLDEQSLAVTARPAPR